MRGGADVSQVIASNEYGVYISVLFGVIGGLSSLVLLRLPNTRRYRGIRSSLGATSLALTIVANVVLVIVALLQWNHAFPYVIAGAIGAGVVGWIVILGQGWIVGQIARRRDLRTHVTMESRERFELLDLDATHPWLGYQEPVTEPERVSAQWRSGNTLLFVAVNESDQMLAFARVTTDRAAIACLTEFHIASNAPARETTRVLINGVERYLASINMTGDIVVPSRALAGNRHLKRYLAPGPSKLLIV